MTTDDYKKIVKAFDINVYNDLTKLVPEIPDQRLFESAASKVKLQPWTELIVWKYLSEELTILENSDNRGDIYDKVVFEVLAGAGSLQVDDVMYESMKTVTRDWYAIFSHEDAKAKKTLHTLFNNVYCYLSHSQLCPH